MSATVAEAVFYNSDSASPQTINKPAGASAGDLLVVVGSADSGVLTDFGTPSGWTANATTVNISGQRCKVFTHVVAGGDPSSWTFSYNSGAGSAWVLVRVTGADTTPVLVVTSGNSASNGATLDSPTATPSGTNDVDIAILTNSCGGNLLSYVQPTGLTDLGKTQASVLFQGLAASWKALSSGSATGAQTWSSISPTAKQCGTFTILVKSAGGGAVSGDAAFTGTGSEAATGGLAAVSAAALTETGAIAGTGKLAAVAGAAVVETGTIAATATRNLTSAGAAAETGALAGTGQLAAVAGATLTETASLAADATRILTSGAAPVETGAIAGAGQLAAVANAALTGTGTLGASATIGAAGPTIDAALAETGTLAGAGQLAASAAGALAGSGTLAADVTRTLTSGAALSGAGAPAGAGQLAAVAGAALVGTGTIAAGATVSGPTINGALVASCAVTAAAGVNARGDAAMIVTAGMLVGGQSAMVASGSLQAMVVIQASADSVGTGDVDVASWWSLLSIIQEAKELRRDFDNAAPVACPNDGEPLSEGPRGFLFCRFDGYRWPEDATGPAHGIAT